MSNLSKEVDKRIRNGEINWDAKPPKKEKNNIAKRIVLWPFKFLLSMFGFDLDELKENVGSSSNVRDRAHYMPTHSHSTSPAAFRETYRSPFDPHTFNPVEAENLKRYLQSMDGKGDPVPHHCDHEH